MMETKEVTVCLETNTTPVLKPTMAITQTVSNEFIKIMELNESCNIFESYLKDFEIKIQLLLNSKSESSNLKDIYLARNRTNMTNTESLRLAKNELYKYKCELKADYIATEKSLRAKRLKYKNVIASYESEWQKTLEQYNSNPLVNQLCTIQQEVSDLEKQFEELDRLYDYTKTQYTSFNEGVRKKFMEKVVEFSKEVLLYKTVVERVAEKKKKELEEKQQKPEHVQRSFFKHGFLKLDVENSEPNNEGNNCSGIDVSILDDIMIPIQNLETQNEEELFPLLDTTSKPVVTGGFDKTQGVGLKTEESQASRSEKPDKEPVDQAEDVCNPDLVKPSKVTENESQYFQSDGSKPPRNEGIHVSESWNQTEETHRRFGKKEEELEKRGEPSTHSKPISEKFRNEEEFHRFLQGSRNFQMESEGNVSDGSCESQYDCLIQNKSMEDKQRAVYEYHDEFEAQYCNTSPTTSEEIPRGMSTENPNDSGGSIDQPPAENQNPKASSKNEAKPQEDAFKSFTNFFTMNDDYNSPTPSIFKLF